MSADIARGAALGIFSSEDLEITASLTAGAILGAALDLHRGVLPASAIEAATARMLVALGVAPERALALAAEPLAPPAPPALPLGWLTLPAVLQEPLGVA